MIKPTPEQIAKLPLWARDIIGEQKGIIDAMQRQLREQEDPQKSKTLVTPAGSQDSYGIPDRSNITFLEEAGGPLARSIQVRREVSSKNPGLLELYVSGGDSVRIMPEASNTFRIRLDR